MKLIVAIVFGVLSTSSNLYAVEKDPSPLSANGYAVEVSKTPKLDVDNIVFSLADKNMTKKNKPLVLRLSRVTNPSTPQPGEPMPPSYPPTGDRNIVDTLIEAIQAGRAVILVPGSESMAGRPGGVPILGPGGATVFFTVPSDGK